MPAGNAARKLVCTGRQVLQLLMLFHSIFATNAGAGLYLSPCALEEDPKLDIEILPTCFEGAVGSWYRQDSIVENNEQRPRLFSARGQVSVLLSSFLTLQASAHHHIWQSRSGAVINRDARPENIVIQFGNSALFRHRAFVGRSSQPFGLNVNSMASWSENDLDELFFGPTINLVGYSYDNQKDITWSFASGVKDLSKRNAAARDLTMVSRISYDIAALEGTRLIASFSTTELSQRRGGAAIVNRNGKGERTSLEVVRTWTEFPYDPQDFNQLIRINWSGSISPDLEVKAQYEDVWKTHRIGCLTLRQLIAAPLSLDGSVGYKRSEDGVTRSLWFGVLGLEATI